MIKNAVGYIYEDPPSLDIADWEAFCAKMRQEVKEHPDREDAIDTLRFAERMLEELRRDPIVPRKEAA